MHLDNNMISLLRMICIIYPGSEDYHNVIRWTFGRLTICDEVKLRGHVSWQLGVFKCDRW